MGARPISQRAATQRRTQRSHATDAEKRFLAEIGAVSVHEVWVPEPLAAAAQNAASRAASQLGTDVPAIRWFRAVEGGQPVGWFCHGMKDVVWISVSLDVAEVPSTVAHESKHRQDHLAGCRPTEKAARAFAAHFTRNMRD